MPTSCSAYGCTNRHVTGGSLKFFSFPVKNKELLKLWVQAVRRKDFTPGTSSKLCSAHFTENDYLERPGSYITRLKPNAIPTIFEGFPSYYKAGTTNKQASRCSNSSSEVCNVVPIKTEAECLNTVDTLCQATINNVCKVDKEVQTNDSTSIISVLRHQIKVLQQKVRRQKNTITNIKDRMRTLKKKGLLKSAAICYIYSKASVQSVHRAIPNNM